MRSWGMEEGQGIKELRDKAWGSRETQGNPWGHARRGERGREGDGERGDERGEDGGGGEGGKGLIRV